MDDQYLNYLKRYFVHNQQIYNKIYGKPASGLLVDILLKVQNQNLNQNQFQNQFQNQYQNQLQNVNLNPPVGLKNTPRSQNRVSVLQVVPKEKVVQKFVNSQNGIQSNFDSFSMCKISIKNFN